MVIGDPHRTGGTEGDAPSVDEIGVGVVSLASDVGNEIVNLIAVG